MRSAHCSKKIKSGSSSIMMLVQRLFILLLINSWPYLVSVAAQPPPSHSVITFKSLQRARFVKAGKYGAYGNSEMLVQVTRRGCSPTSCSRATDDNLFIID